MPSIINSICCCLLVICLKTIVSSALDACDDRCKDFDNVFCNNGNGVCEDCGVYCSSDSSFYSEQKCLEVCPKDPEPMDACSNRCIIYPDTYCNTATLACDSCNIWCTKTSRFFNPNKCSQLCPNAIPTTSTVKPSITTTSASLTTDRTTAGGGISTSTESNNLPQVNLGAAIPTPGIQEKNVLFISLSVTVAGILAVIVAIIFIMKRKKLKCVTHEKNMENQAIFQTAQPGARIPNGTGHSETGSDKMASFTVRPSDMVIGNESQSQLLLPTNNAVAV